MERMPSILLSNAEQMLKRVTPQESASVSTDNWRFILNLILTGRRPLVSYPALTDQLPQLGKPTSHADTLGRRGYHPGLVGVSYDEGFLMCQFPLAA